MKLRRAARRRLKAVAITTAAVLVAGAAIGGAVLASGPQNPPQASEKVAEFYEANKGLPEKIEPLDAVFIGDSYTYGFGAPKPQRWSSAVARHYGWAEHNFGFGGTGYKTASGIDRCHLASCPAYPESVGKIAADIGPEYVIVAGGRNDSIADVGAWGTAVDQTFSMIRQRFPKATILALNPIAENEQIVAGKAAAVKAAVERVRGHYIDIGQPVMGKLDLLSSDKVHPNAKGYLAISRAFIAKCPETVCKRTPSAGF